MFIADNIFIHGIDFSKKNNSKENDKDYAPWDEEVQNYKKTPLLYDSRRKSASICRYSSQLENYVNKNRKIVESNRKRKNILHNKSITIEYELEENDPLNNKSKIDNKIKLPLIQTKSISRQSSPERALSIE